MKHQKLLAANEHTGYMRLFGSLIDFILLFILTSIIIRFIPDSNGFSDFFYLLIFLEFVYHLVLETLTGYTLGKLIFNLRVINREFQKPSFLQSFIRSLLGLIEANPILVIIPLITFYIIQNNKTGQRLGDLCAGTYVVQSRFAKYDYDQMFDSDSNNLVNDFNSKIPNIYTDTKAKTSVFNCKTYKRIIGTENLTYEKLFEQLDKGKRFVVYPYLINIFILYFHNNTSAIYFDTDSLAAKKAKKNTLILNLVFLIINVITLFTFIYFLITNFGIVYLIFTVLMIILSYYSFFYFTVNKRGGMDVTDIIHSYMQKKQKLSVTKS